MHSTIYNGCEQMPLKQKLLHTHAHRRRAAILAVHVLIRPLVQQERDIQCKQDQLPQLSLLTKFRQHFSPEPT